MIIRIAFVAAWALGAGAVHAEMRPNILWISTEDIGIHFGCYGDENAITPRLDDLAARGWLYENAFTVAPVCAPNRSAIITGMYPSTLGAQHMRSGGEGRLTSNKPELPSNIRMFPQYLREAGYYCTNASKQDYNFRTPDSVWDESSKRAHWKNRPDPDQPFFAVFNFTGTHEGSVRASRRDHERNTARLTEDQRQDPAKVVVPPYQVDTPVVRQQWANYHENITALDYRAGDLLDELEAEGVADNTIVLFWSDHGAGLPRGKRWPYDSGVRVPVIMYVPDALRESGAYPEPGSRIEDLVSSLDFAPTTLELAGIDVPEYMAGRSLLSDPAPEYVYAIRDRMDERYDMVRTVRSKDFLYIRNYMPWLPYNQFLNTAEKSPVRREMYRAMESGELPPGAQWFAADEKPVEELYVIADDPHQIDNVAATAEYEATLVDLREEQFAWYLRTRDTGLFPEPAMWRAVSDFGNRTNALATFDTKLRAELLTLATEAGSKNEARIDAFVALTGHQTSAIRYWAGIGLALQPAEERFESALAALLDDPAGEVRIVAAEALAKHYNRADEALPVLIDALQSDEEWVRLHAAIALDHLDETARPAIPALREALNDTENKYVVRVSNRALNQLEQTQRSVR